MDILAEAKQLIPELTRYRRALHRFPELSGSETHTAHFICSSLSSLGVEYSAPAENIVIAYIGPDTSDSVAFRVDIDALPINEASGVPYASEVPGIMHACGHDAHTALALCCVRMLKTIESSLTRRVVFIFQPSEETGEGAEQVLNTGALSRISEIYGLHVDPESEAGSILVSPGPVNMGSGKFRITINGKTGHGSMPHLCHDALLCGALIVTEAQSIVQRCVSCLSPALLSIGRFGSNGAWNIISDHTEIEGLFRYSDKYAEPIVTDKLRGIINSSAAFTGCSACLDYTPNATPINNDAELSDNIKNIAASYGINVIPEPLLPIADDFAAYQKIAKVCYIRAGIGSSFPNKERYPLHSDHFRLEESSLANALAVITSVLSSSQTH